MSTMTSLFTTELSKYVAVQTDVAGQLAVSTLKMECSTVFSFLGCMMSLLDI